MRPEDLPADVTGDTLERIVEDGSDLSKPMDIDFCVAVPNREAGLQVSNEAEQLGFKTDVVEDDESGNWTCYCTKVIIGDCRQGTMLHITALLREQWHGDAIYRRFNPAG